MSTWIQRWRAWLGAPVDAASLAVFRIVFGLMLAWDAYRYLTSGWIDEYYVLPEINFTYFPLDFVRPLPGPLMHLLFGLIGALALLVAAGLFYRVAVALLFVAYTYVFLLEVSVYMNHYYLIALVALLLSCMPANRAYSLDRWRGAEIVETIPFWCVALLRFQLFVVYFYGAIAKLNHDWLRGEPMLSILQAGGPEVPEVASLLPAPLLAYFIAYSGILIDAAVPLLLVFRRTVVVGYVFAVLFHILNEIFLYIGVFSYLMSGAITIFFAPDWPRRGARHLGFKKPAPPLVGERRRSPGTLMFAVLHVYIVLQLLIPFRHLLYPGYVSWTEEGHRFAWHMKLRKKISRIEITATDPATGRSWNIDPAADLRPRQLRKLGTFPGMMLQYVHHHRDKLRTEGIDPVIKVDWQCSLNGRPEAPLIDPDVDLAKVEPGWGRSDWILPYPER
jgi:vitamin K-dependent gamma-carboxylase